MSEAIEAYPLTWPVGRPRSRSRKDGQFDREATIGGTRNQLLAEPGRFGARAIIISSNLRLRLDGLPMASQSQPDDTGVAVYFRLNNVQHVIACDAYRKVLHNLRAIAKTIEAQRGILRWGAVTAEQIFAGFKALPPVGEQAPPSTPGTLSLEDAAVFVANEGGPVPYASVIGSADTYKAAYRRAVQKFHPDRNNGRHLESWARLQDAAAVLKRHHKIL